MAAASPDHWSLDKRVPVAVIATLATQLIGGIVMVTLLWRDVEDHGVRLDRIEARVIEYDRQQNEIHVAVVRLQEAAISLRDVTQELKMELRALRSPMPDRRGERGDDRMGGGEMAVAEGDHGIDEPKEKARASK